MLPPPQLGTMLPFGRNGNGKNRPRFTLPALFTQTEFFDDGTISFDILLCQIAKQILSVTNHFKQTALRMEILGIFLHVLGEHIDAVGENGNLHLGRTCVVFTGSVVRDDLLFEFFLHLFSPFCDNAAACIPLSQPTAGESGA